jgi:hypothetical protein
MTRRVGIACVVFAASLLWLGPARADQAVTFGADPAPGSSLENGYYSLHLGPGSAMRQTLHLSNTSDSAAELHLAAVDATTGQKGSVAYGADDSTPAREGAWIHLDETVVHLPAKRAKDVSFEVRVPPAARPGAHVAGIVVFAPRTTTSQSAGSSGSAGAVVVVESRRAVAVQVILPGRIDPLIVISAMTTEARPDGLNVIVAMANQGYGLTKGSGRLAISGPTTFAKDFSIDTFLPETEIRYPIPWSKTPPDGTYHAHAVVDYGDKHATFDADLVVGAAERAALQNRVAKPTVAPAAKTSKRGLPVGLAIGLGLAGGAVLFWLIPFLVRRRRRPPGTPAAS